MTHNGEAPVPTAFRGWLVLAACGLALACGGQTQQGGDSLPHGGSTGSDAHATTDTTGGNGGNGGSGHAGEGGIAPLDGGVIDPSFSRAPADDGLDLAGDAPCSATMPTRTRNVSGDRCEPRQRNPAEGLRCGYPLALARTEGCPRVDRRFVGRLQYYRAGSCSRVSRRSPSIAPVSSNLTAS